MSLEVVFGTSFPLGVLTASGCTLTIAYSPILALVELEIRSWATDSFLGGNNDSSSISNGSC